MAACQGQDFLRGGLWSSAFTGVFYVDTPSLSQDFDWTKGAHSISFGGIWTRPHPDGDGTFQANGNMGFSGLFTSGTTQRQRRPQHGRLRARIPELVPGRSAARSTTRGYTPSALYVGRLVAREPPVDRELRRCGGSRIISAKDANGFNTAFIRDNYRQGHSEPRSIANAPIGLVFPGDPGFPTDGGNTGNKWAQFAPRVGVVWDPAGDNVQTIRAGAGIYFDSPKLWETAHHMLNPPFGNTVERDRARPRARGKPNKNGCPLDFVNPWSATPGGDPQANFGHIRASRWSWPAKNVAVPDERRLRQHARRRQPDASDLQWNVSYQRQLPGRMLAEVTYTGNKTEHIWVPGYQENPSIYIPGNCVAGQYRLDGAGSVFEHDDGEPPGARAPHAAEPGGRASTTPRTAWSRRIWTRRATTTA